MKAEWGHIIFEIMSEGGSVEEALVSLGFSEAFHNELLETDVKYHDAIVDGELRSYAWWLEFGRYNLGNKSFNNTLYNFTMKNRFGWSDTQKTDGKAMSVSEDKTREHDNIKKFKIAR